MGSAINNMSQKVNDGRFGERGDMNGLFEASNWDQKTEFFNDMMLKDGLLRGIYIYGFENPLPLQQLAIVPCIQGRDVIVQAESGTGKTTAFAISILQRVNEDLREVQAVIAVPTLEIAKQTREVTQQLGGALRVFCQACADDTAKVNVGKIMRRLERGVHIVIGTVSRLNYLIQRHILKPETIKTLVVDDVDKMFALGFKDQVYGILQSKAADTLIILQSATLSPDILMLMRQFARNPVRILMKGDEKTSSAWCQSVTYYRFAEKTETHWFRIFFSQCDRQFYVNPGFIGQMSPVLHRIFLDESFADAQNGEVCLPDEKPENILEFLQATVPGIGGNLCKPISVSNCIILMRYANIWLIDSLKRECARYVKGEYKITPTSLKESITMLEAACEYGCDDKEILGILIGRCAAFGPDKLLTAKIHESTKLTVFATGLLLGHAHKANSTSYPISRSRADDSRMADIRPIPECNIADTDQSHFRQRICDPYNAYYHEDEDSDF